MGLAERKVKSKYMPDPSNSRWSKDATGVGHRLLASQGWTPQTGLGAAGQGIIKPLAAAIKFDSKGVGAQQKSDDWSWTGGEMFGDILARLNTSNVGIPAVEATAPVVVEMQPPVKTVVVPIRNASRAKHRAAKSGLRQSAPESINLMLGITSKPSSAITTPITSPRASSPVASTSAESLDVPTEKSEEKEIMEVVIPQKNSSNLSVTAYFKLKVLQAAALAKGEVFIPPPVSESVSLSAPVLGEEASVKTKYGPAPEQRKVEGKSSHMKFDDDKSTTTKRKREDDGNVPMGTPEKILDAENNLASKETKTEKKERKRLKKLAKMQKLSK